jgi:hypothetical protein
MTRRRSENDDSKGGAAAMKLPAFMFYPGDWLRDSALSGCSLAARGLWIEMMCHMHQADPYGFLLVNGKPLDAGQLARMVGGARHEVLRLLAELNDAGVFSTDAEGRIYSRRMVRDQRVRRARAEGGKRSLENPNVPRPRAVGRA